jgi:hypothetical protein
VAGPTVNTTTTSQQPPLDDAPSGLGHLAPVDPTFGHGPLDLDMLIQQTVSQFPLPDAWFDAFPPPDVGPGGMEPFHQPPIRSPAITSRYRGYSFKFLSDFTCRTGLVSSFECATLEQRQQIVDAFHRSYLGQQPTDYFGALPPLCIGSGEVSRQQQGLHPSLGLVDHNLTWSSWLHNPTVIKLQQVVSLVKNVVTVKPKNSAVTLTWSTALEQKCLDFFSPTRFAKFIELYWSVWHPNVDLLHRPSFDPTSAKSILLAAMALVGKYHERASYCNILTMTGACASPDPADNEDAKMWFNCVEEMVFTDDDFCRDIDPPAEIDIESPVSTVDNQRKLQALQAAYIVCLYQNWEGTDASKRRIRRHRFSTVVSVSPGPCSKFLRRVYSHSPDRERSWHRHRTALGLQHAAQARIRLV